jgi:hypothetical protein
MKTPGQTINEMPAGTFTTLCKVAPIGSLQARRDKTGTVSLFWRYSIGTKSERVTIGTYDSAAPPRKPDSHSQGLQRGSCRADPPKHWRWSITSTGPNGGRPALLAAGESTGSGRSRQMAARASLFTLKSLLTDYADHQRALGTVSSKDAQNIFREPCVQAMA